MAARTSRHLATTLFPTLELGKAWFASRTPIRPPIAIDDASPQAVAAGVLVHRIDPALARATFSGISPDAPELLVALLARADFQSTADFGSMVVLAALESVIGLPDAESATSDGLCDVGILVALKEEFRVLHERFQDCRAIIDEALLLGSGLDFVNVRPGLLLNRPARGKVRASLDGRDLGHSITREDVATFMVDQLTSDEWLRKSPIIGY